MTRPEKRVRRIASAVAVTLMAIAGIVSNAGSDRDLRFSPDGKVFAFSSTRNGTPALFVANADGSGLRRVTDHAAVDGAPAWSPDGKTLAFHSNVDGNFEIYTIHADGTGLKRWTDSEGLDFSPSFSPDGKKMFYATDREGGQLRSIDVESGEDSVHATGMEHHNAIRFSPDGSRLAGVVMDGKNWEIAILSVDAEKRRILAPHPSRDSGPVWSPDGKRIAFSSKRDATDWDVYVVDVDGGNLTRLTRDEGRDFVPAWLPDGTAVVFASNRSGEFEFYTVKPDGSGMRPFGPIAP